MFIFVRPIIIQDDYITYAGDLKYATFFLFEIIAPDIYAICGEFEWLDESVTDILRVSGFVGFQDNLLLFLIYR